VRIVSSPARAAGARARNASTNATSLTGAETKAAGASCC
jgi:hypothetical protein